MVFSFVTYNVHFNLAYDYIKEIFEKEMADIVCLQEVITSEENLNKFSRSFFKLADFGNSFVQSGKIYGVATFYNPSVFKLVQSESFEISNGLREVLMTILSGGIKQPRTVLKTDFIHILTGKKISIYNIHFSAIATNGVRIKQLNETLEDLKNIKKQPLVLAGDFNYPYGRKKFEKLIHKYYLKEATDNIFFTIDTKIFYFFTYRVKLDYVLYKNLKKIETRKILVKHSDHLPILSKFEI